MCPQPSGTWVHNMYLADIPSMMCVLEGLSLPGHPQPDPCFAVTNPHAVIHTCFILHAVSGLKGAPEAFTEVRSLCASSHLLAVKAGALQLVKYMLLILVFGR